jgi:hypothetical protein
MKLIKSVLVGLILLAMPTLAQQPNQCCCTPRQSAITSTDLITYTPALTTSSPVVPLGLVSTETQMILELRGTVADLSQQVDVLKRQIKQLQYAQRKKQR